MSNMRGAINFIHIFFISLLFDNVSVKILILGFFQCNQAAPQRVKTIEDGVDPKKVCTEIKLCQSGKFIILNTKTFNDVKLDVSIFVECVFQRISLHVILHDSLLLLQGLHSLYKKDAYSNDVKQFIALKNNRNGIFRNIALLISHYQQNRVHYTV